MTGDGSTQEPTEADARIAAESLALRRSALDPLRAIGAAESAGFSSDTAERHALAELLERLEDVGTVVLSGDPEGRSRVTALLVADAWVRGEERVLFVGPRPRAVDRLCARCERDLIEVRNERGAYTGAGLFWVPDLDAAPPGLGGADPFARVIHVGAPVDGPPWSGPTVWVTDELDGVAAPALVLTPARRHGAPTGPEGEAVDAVLQEPLLCLEPALGPLARRAAEGTNADRGAVLGRLTTRLGRMVRAARAKRSDDGAETARQLASDHDGIDDGMLAAALDAAGAGAAELAALEAERARLEELRATLTGANDPVFELLMVRARAALAAGNGAALVLPGRASREAALEALGDSVAAGESVEDRLAAARAGAVAVVSLAEHREERLDRVAYAGLRVIADARSPIPEATELVGEGTSDDAPTVADDFTHELDADEEQWAHWRRVLALDAPLAHPTARDAVERGRERSAHPWRLARLRRDEGDALVVIGESRDWEPAHPTLDEGVFHAELELLRVARVRLERALADARSTWARARTELAKRRRAAESAIEEARRRKERALGDDARRDAARALEEAEAALAPLDDEARTLMATHDAERRRAFERFATRSTVEAIEDDGASSHPGARVAG